MTAALELQRERRRDIGPHVPFVLGDLGQRAPGVEPRQRRRARLHPTERRADAPPQCVDHLGLPRADPLLGAEHLGLVFLELGRHVALGARERLAALVVARHALTMRVGDFDVITEDLVESDLERADAGALPLARLQAGDVLLAAVARVLQLVQLAVEPGADRVAVLETRGWAVDERAGELFAPVAGPIELSGQRVTRECAQGAGDVGQATDRVAQRTELAGSRTAQRRAPRQALEVWDAVGRFAQPRAPATVLD